MKLRQLCLLLTGFYVMHAAPTAFGGTKLTPLKSLNEKQFSFLRPALEASFGFRLNPGVNCTGTFISDNGHFITALHCISACLRKIGALEREPAFPGRISLRPTYKVSVDELFLKSNPVCKGKLGDKEVDVVVIATGGKGWLEPRNGLAALSKASPDDYKELVDDGFEHGADYAVLQIPGLKPKACLPLTDNEIADGEILHAVSYPCVKRNGVQYTGGTPLYTSGAKTGSFKESAYYKKLGSSKIEFHVDSVERHETFFSDLDIEKCGSGTAVFDENLNIVGIATRVYKTSTKYETGALESIRSSHILKELKNKRPADLKSITSCSAPSAPTSLVSR